jgi:hypothetical protein
MSEERSLGSGHQYLGGLCTFLYRAVRNSLPLMIVVTLLVMVIAYFVTPRPAPIYGAQASVQIGRVAGAEAMSLQASAAHVNARSFKRRVLQAMNLPAVEDDRASRLFSESLTARPEEFGTLSVNIRGSSEQQVRQTLDLVVRLLNQDQGKVSDPILADINTQLTEIDANIASLIKAREALLALTKASTTDARPEGQADDLRSLLVLDVLSRNENLRINEQADRRELASRLGPSNTYPTAIVDDVLVSSAPGAPRPSRTALLAGVLTFVGFLLYALLRGRRVVGPN